ncbi:DUF6990 domain-containing protein [Rhodophyticola porphyridii]|uniref:Uncharacterized protein n=1 Tax=Rhodophyticola porphyridii TaxID=1852017 RepID=A0A3L9XZS0_9RHOB|nr:hypothetical protein [Rhodophyticola porphyridii]RMA40615.1 hypothetical protein D9R08_18770 [Rhodophyticola porphyridii]
MTTAEVAKTLKALGWTNGVDYDRFSRLRLNDRVVEMGWKLRNYGPTLPQLLETRSALEADWFSRAVEVIFDKKRVSSIAVEDRYNRIEARPITPHIVSSAADQAVAWAQVQDLDAHLQAYRERSLELGFDAFGIYHLAALALCGDIGRLKHYKERYAAGHLEEFGHGRHIPANRLHINTESITRAIDYAEGVIARGEVRSPAASI